MSYSTEEYSVDAIAEACTQAAVSGYQIFLVVATEEDQPCDFAGLVTVIRQSASGIWLKDQVYGDTIFLSHLIHDHQRGVDWRAVRDNHVMEDVLGCIHTWRANWNSVDRDLFESLTGYNVLPQRDSEASHNTKLHAH